MRHKDFISASMLGVSLSAALIAAMMANGQAKIPENPLSEVSVICGASVLPGVKAVEPETVETVKVVTGDFPAVVLPIPDRDFAKPYTEEELEMLALVIYQEAGGNACTDETRLMVGQVVLNRVADDRYPNTIEEVITQKAQYGRLYWTGLVWPERAYHETEKEAVERAYKCAEMVLNGEKLLPDDVIYQAEFCQGSEVIAHSDGFYFCR